MSTAVVTPEAVESPWVLPSKGRVGMACLIIAETAIFTIFVVAYVYYMGKTTSGPTPREVLSLPIFNSICLLSSSVTIWLAEHAIERGEIRKFGVWWAVTIALGAIFLIGTANEWRTLIYHDGLTVSTNLFGTTFYCLVGLHASHVIIGLLGLLTVLIFTLTGRVKQEHSERVQVLALYWHFVDAVWIVVFTVVYVIGR
ncbi:heme-copper oxidase subunit III [Granulicella sp. WH15]|uniref:cytochrome c oxidase subunit 3 n=1 Tax=Granulicella sp. WH15 TaxID=2602070 RepID=UPI0013669008|nr:heme-copper oxidase subunit III [Granulicella sp. WH15]QHN02582.1 heme-copper oxidase subunit III [Granulicella sp. WH15]